MVNFVLLNEMSLPLSRSTDVYEKFFYFLKIAKDLKKRNIEKIRIEKDLKDFEIIDGVYFQEFLGTIKNPDSRTKIKAFFANRTIQLESPLIKDDEDSGDLLIENEYFFNGNSTIGAFACAEIYNTIVISFSSNQLWDRAFINIKKESINSSNKEDIKIRHISTLEHFSSHDDYFEKLEKFLQLNIKPSNFWDKKDYLFKNKILICQEVKEQISSIDSRVFNQALSILRDLDSGDKQLKDFTTSSESKSVQKTPALKKLREFYVDSKREFFKNHIKNLPKGYRIHYLEKNEKIYIGYVGKHLPTKKF